MKTPGIDEGEDYVIWVRDNAWWGVHNQELMDFAGDGS